LLILFISHGMPHVMQWKWFPERITFWYNNLEKKELWG